MEKFIPLEQASEVRKESTRVQHQHISAHLASVNLTNVYVEKSPVFRDPADFAQRLTIAFSGGLINELPLTILAAAGKFQTTRFDGILPLLVFPDLTESGLLVDRVSGQEAVTNAWVCEGNLMQRVYFTSPLPVTTIDTSFDPMIEDRTLDLHQEQRNAIFDLTQDKQCTKELLAEHGILTPKGMLLSARKDADEQEIQDWVEEHVPGKGIVIKANTGSQSQQIEMFTADYTWLAVKKAAMYAQPNATGWGDVLLEERLIEHELPDEFLEAEAIGRNEPVQWNLRSICTLSASDPKLIDTEIRYRIGTGSEPVSISKGAYAATVDSLEGHPLLVEIEELAKAATKVICSELLPDGITIPGIIGWDLMYADDKQLYILEANVGNVGGFGTLTRLRKFPLESIALTYLPALREYLGYRHNRAASLSHPGAYERIPTSEATIDFLKWLYKKAKVDPSKYVA